MITAIVAGALLLGWGCGASDRARIDRTGPTATSLGDRADEWQAVLDEHRAGYGAPGAVAAVGVGDERWSGTSGVADLDGTALTPASRFKIGSITKPIVAALVLDAVGRGQLALDDSVEDLQPGLLRDGRATTVRMLLDHTSGLFAEGDEGDLLADMERLGDPAQRAEAAGLATRFLAGEAVTPSVQLLVALAETHDPYAPPGEGYHYSNVNYLVAAMLLEQATGMPLADLVRTRLVEPLGLRHTTIAPDDGREPDLRGYVPAEAGELVDPGNAHLLLLGNGGAGGITSTPEEVLTMLQAIVSGALLPESLVDEMLHPTAASGSQAYGLGIATYSLSCGTFYGHEGSIDGTGAIALVSTSGADGAVVALSGRGPDDPRLPAVADSLLCGGP